MKNTALVLAGGVGSRMNMGSFPKQYLMVDDRPVLDYCLCTFQNAKIVDAIVIVADPSWRDFIEQWLKKSGITKFVAFADPGETRQMSIFNGLEVIEQQEADCENVIIHDSARPLISQTLIENCFLGLQDAEGVMPVLPVKDTCYQSLDGRSISGFLPRSQLFAGQAPEAFRLQPYLQLHRTLPLEVLLEISGSSELAYKHGLKVAMIPGEEKNFKITTQDDLKLLEKYLHSEETK